MGRSWKISFETGTSFYTTVGQNYDARSVKVVANYHIRPKAMLKVQDNAMVSPKFGSQKSIEDPARNHRGDSFCINMKNHSLIYSCYVNQKKHFMKFNTKEKKILKVVLEGTYL